MSQYICPFSKSECNPSCIYWKSEQQNKNMFSGFIPINIGVQDVSRYIAPYIKNKWLKMIVEQYTRYSANNTSTPLANGYCTRIEDMNKQEND